MRRHDTGALRGCGAREHPSSAPAELESCRSFVYEELQRASAAWRAISRRRRALNFSARARPPFNPPSRPRAIACGFFRRGMPTHRQRRCHGMTLMKSTILRRTAVSDRHSGVP